MGPRVPKVVASSQEASLAWEMVVALGQASPLASSRPSWAAWACLQDPRHLIVRYTVKRSKRNKKSQKQTAVFCPVSSSSAAGPSFSTARCIGSNRNSRSGFCCWCSGWHHCRCSCCFRAPRFSSSCHLAFRFALSSFCCSHPPSWLSPLFLLLPLSQLLSECLFPQGHHPLAQGFLKAPPLAHKAFPQLMPGRMVW